MNAIALEYHDIIDHGDPDASGFPGRDAATYKLDRSIFEAHLEAIRSIDGSRPESVMDAHKGSHTATLLTFDDGGSSAPIIAELLEARGWTGHFFITTDRIGTPGFVTAAQIQDLRRQGHVVGSHSSSHPVRMAACSDDELSREWVQSTDSLASILGEPVATASVPGGYYDRRVAEAAAAAGIEVLFTSEPTTRWRWVGSCQVIGRYTLRSDSTAGYAAALVRGQFGPRVAQAVIWNAKKVAKALGGTHYLRFRSRLFR